MNYTINNSQPNLNSWIKENINEPPFTQSFEWTEILKNENKIVERLAILDNNKIIATTLVEYREFFLGLKYAFCPLGPVYSSEADQEKILNDLSEYFKNKKCVFFRIENQTELSQNILHTKTRNLNPRATIKINLAQTQEKILKQMHSKTRYNIGLAERKNLTIKTEKNLPIFIELMKKTGARDGFRPHPQNHYKNILNSPFAHQITIYKNDIPLATGIFIGFGEVFTYLFGASDHSYRNLMAPYLLQWTAIKMGQNFGNRFYDFFGIAPTSADANHQYSAITRFKIGFGGKYFETSGTFDIIINHKKYFFYKVLRKIKSLV
jgi:lipid II:glycine glycyltransferase (peptidoglycan interpeptide bridge formation enzyme)